MNSIKNMHVPLSIYRFMINIGNVPLITDI